MIPRQFENISFEDIAALLDSGVTEGKTIEYKRELPNEGDSKKIPSLAEVSAFANTAGGDLIFGVEERQGVPVSIVGVQTDNIDAEILRLNTAVLNGIEPRIPQISIKALKEPGGRHIVLLRVGKSWAAPNRVSYKDHSKFYGRNSAGKYPLDVGELRAAFTISELLGARIRNFRQDRVTALLAGQELPVLIAGGGKLALHIVPLPAFSGPGRSLIAPTSNHATLFRPIGAGGWSHRINLDGLATYDGGSEAKSYTQVFRSGTIETASVLQETQGRQLLPCKWYEKEIVRTIASYLSGLKRFDVNRPFYVFISLIGMKDFRLYVGEAFFEQGEALDRDLVLIPEVAIDNQEPGALANQLRPAFDMVWNAFGYERSFNYDEEGNWKA